MSPLLNNKLLSYGTVLLTAVVFLIISMETNDLVRHLTGTGSLMEFLYATNNILAFIIPILTFGFFTVTTRIMLRLIDQEIPERRSLDLPTLIGFCFIPLLLYALFFSFCFLALDPGSSINNVDDLLTARLGFGMNLTDFKTLRSLTWVLVYALLVVQLRHFLKLSLLKALLVALAPTTLLYLLKLLGQLSGLG